MSPLQDTKPRRVRPVTSVAEPPKNAVTPNVYNGLGRVGAVSARVATWGNVFKCGVSCYSVKNPKRV